MKDDDRELWLQSAQQFQQTMTDSWSKAFESFQNMDLGAAAKPLMAPTVKPPKVEFSADKLQELQQQYLKEATELWTSSLQEAPKEIGRAHV